MSGLAKALAFNGVALAFLSVSGATSADELRLAAAALAAVVAVGIAGGWAIGRRQARRPSCLTHPRR